MNIFYFTYFHINKIFYPTKSTQKFQYRIEIFSDTNSLEMRIIIFDLSFGLGIFKDFMEYY